MTDLTLKDFCEQFDACPDGYEYGCSLTDKKGDAMMSEIWPLMDNRDYMLWVISRDDVLTPQERVAFAVRCIRETPIGNGKTVFDLLTDQRSINAILVCEAFVKGDATYEDVKIAAADAARAAAYAVDAADDTADDAAADAAYAAAYAADAAADARAAAYAAADAAADARAHQLQILKSLPNPFLEVTQ